MLTSFNSGYLSKEDGHEIYFAEYGNPKGEIVLTLHGGPGSHHKPHHVECFDLTQYHIIAFDQRGCGQSKFKDVIKGNNTQKLISDIERLRQHLGIKSWFVAGSSWGSTLALSYAETYPKPVKGLLLRSIFLARKEDNDWAFGVGGVSRLFPDLLDKTKSDFTPLELFRKIEHATLSERNHLITPVLNWEGNLLSSQTDLTFTKPSEVTDEHLNMVKISLHYLANNYFLKDNEILTNIHKIKNIPTIIVHGRYDILCPVDGAYTLSQNLKKSELIILPSSNHKLTADGLIAQKLAYKSFLLLQGV